MYIKTKVDIENFIGFYRRIYASSDTCTISFLFFYEIQSSIKWRVFGKLLRSSSLRVTRNTFWIVQRSCLIKRKCTRVFTFDETFLADSHTHVHWSRLIYEILEISQTAIFGCRWNTWKSKWQEGVHSRKRFT